MIYESLIEEPVEQETNILDLRLRNPHESFIIALIPDRILLEEAMDIFGMLNSFKIYGRMRRIWRADTAVLEVDLR